MINDGEKQRDTDTEDGDQKGIEEGEDVVIGNEVSWDSVADKNRSGCHPFEEHRFDIEIGDFGKDLGRGFDRQGKSDLAVIGVEEGLSCFDHGEDDGECHRKSHSKNEKVE